jgi:LCP family protein required for cell wall assembly
LLGDVGGKDGIKKAGQLISEITGARIDRHLEINFQGFEHLVDLLDGIEVNVTQPVRYLSKDGLPIAEINPGKQVLSGEQALLYVRYLDQKGEADRFARQRLIFQAIFAKAAQPGNFINAMKMNNALKKYTKTDLSVQEVLQLVAFAKSIDLQQNITIWMLPGTAEDTYWQPDYPEIRRFMKQLGAAKNQ